jgi:hypothetical protein
VYLVKNRSFCHFPFLLGAHVINGIESQVTHRSNQIMTENSVSLNALSLHQKTSEERSHLRLRLLILHVCFIRDVP